MSGAPEEVDWSAYLDLASKLVDLPVREEHRAATIEQLELNHRMAQLLLACPLPEGLDLAPVFRP